MTHGALQTVAPWVSSGLVGTEVGRIYAGTGSLRLTKFYAFNVLLKWSTVRCQASLAAASSKRGVVSLWKP